MLRTSEATAVVLATEATAVRDDARKSERIEYG